MFKKEFRLHEQSGLWVARDGEVLVPQSGKHHEHYTYGYKRKDGYREVCYQGKRYLVHRLVAECYIPNNGKPYIDHLNTNRSDNRVENLRWSTHSENCNNPLSRQHFSEAQKGNTNKPKKPVIGVNKTTGEIVEFESLTDAWLTLNIKQSDICSCCKGKLKSAGGWKWAYLT